MTQSRKQGIALDSHQFIDFLNLAYHQAVAARLLADPEAVLKRARNNLQCWLAAYQPGESDARCFEEWQRLLATRTVPELLAIIIEDSDEGQRLRHLPESYRWKNERSGATAVKKWQLLDLIRRVHELTNINEPVIVGSQSLFAITDQVPPIVARSVEADFRQQFPV